MQYNPVNSIKYTHDVCSFACLLYRSVHLEDELSITRLTRIISGPVGEMKKCYNHVMFCLFIMCIIRREFYRRFCCRVEGTTRGVSINLPSYESIYQIVREINDFFVT